MEPIESPASALARVLVARREQLTFRLGLAVVSAGGCMALIGWRITLVWLAAYVAVQMGEHRAFRDVSSASDLTPGRIGAVLAAIAAGTFVFGAIGLLLAMVAGPWGLVCGSLVWCGMIVNGAMVNSGSRPALLASITPTGLYFLSAPLFVLAAGESIIYGLVMIFASALNMVVVLKIWSMSRTLIDAERRERRMTYLTLHDPESGLPNRTALEQDIAGMPASDSNSILVVAVLGIDRFTQLRGGRSAMNSSLA
jgi:hypothetical protein